ncbi:hypothetical protein N7495_006666 [Penicillium taxi]|uniref:uncharacterized protein n=1 Tax=Penicillium taxi TaxID=168475 RepID=UPI002544E360|nr:uncharacterized protein N7495_006666 [Penicillium taxi]KAJ5894975.1 hypothetical protein N7495_006666 [Penicillium taxi]
MATEGPRPGFLGNLNPEQQAKLRKLWTIVLKATDADKSSSGDVDEKTSEPAQNKVSSKPALSPCSQQVLDDLKQAGIGAQETKRLQKSFSAISPSELGSAIFETLKQDHPDATLLRFLRARKWNISNAFLMMMEAIVWRAKEMHVDDDILVKGELHAWKQAQNKSDPSEKKAGEDFLAQLRLGKGYVHGTDKAGRPIVVVRVRLHKPGAQSEETLERFIVHLIESVRLNLSPPLETAAAIFDMTGFSLSNMEYPPVNFVLKCFEANYPECLGTMIIHNSPWAFSGIWRLIRGWMDPEIAAKVQFTNSADDIAKYIDRDNFPKEIGGTDEWTYKYIEPEENENAKMEDTTTRDALCEERRQISEEFLAATIDWIKVTDSKDESLTKSVESRRDDLIERLRSNYWKLDPYVRARMCLDRVGVVKSEGKIDLQSKIQD